MITSVLGFTPQIAKDTFIASSAEIIGNVQIQKSSSIWFHVTIRGDVGPIRIGEKTNIQDNTVIHGSFNKAFSVIGNQVTIGHSVILHGCRVDDLCLIGMGSIIMDNAHIGARSIVGAGSLVTENSVFEPGQLIMGRPAKAVRPLTVTELEFLPKSAQNYVLYKSWYENPNQKPPAHMKFEL
jgi:carbonic anhydrase/acetyltransferase-like protein (isoleucine patch superfamily)